GVEAEGEKKKRLTVVWWARAGRGGEPTQPLSSRRAHQSPPLHSAPPGTSPPPPTGARAESGGREAARATPRDPDPRGEMGVRTRRLQLLSAAAAVFLLLLHAPPLAWCADLDALVYKGCANQSFPGGALPPTVAALSSALSGQAGSVKFYKTSSPSAAGSSTSVFGLFQCRGDLSGSDCASCVSRATSSWRDVCGASVAARVQLAGCLALYEVSGFPQVSGVQMLFKTCGTGSGGGGDFEMRRDTAFAALEGGVATSSGGFVATSYQAVYAMAQCEGDLSTGDCGQCVTQAVQHVEVECGGASSGQVYLDKCYISYSYYPHGVPHGGGTGGQQTSKTVAIVLGGAVGVGFLVICLLFARSLVKKKDDY
ncbi:unnamed protein product, partial [Urochloa humidicola]